MEAGALGEGAVWPNLKTFPFRKFRGCIDILSGGFPCQPFSQAGKGHGDTDPRHLFPFIKQGIADCRPSLVVLENVEGIVSAKLKGDHWRDPAGTPVLLHVIRELERVGYRATAVPTSASEVGAPHQRNRWFIVGVLANTELSSSPRLEHLCGLIGASSETKGNQACPRGFGVWPSRPGQEQFGWEPPRVVGDPKNERVEHTPEQDIPETGVMSSGASEGGVVGKSPSEGLQERGVSSLGQCEGEEPEPERPDCEDRVVGGQEKLVNAPDVRSCGAGSVAGEAGSDTQGEECRVHESSGAGPLPENEPQPGCNSEESGLQGTGDSQTQSTVGRDIARATCGLDYAELCESCDNRTDELRLLGNGVVPQSCADAVRRGLEQLMADTRSL